jgi:spore coat protein U-like protein
MMRRIAVAALFLLAVGARQAAAQACSVSFTTLNYATYTGTLLNGTATGTVSCATAWTLGLNAGLGAGATETIRKMTGPGGATLNYQLFMDAARTVNFGNTTSNEQSGTGNTTITIYGQIPAGQFIAPGTYTDTVSSASASFTVTAVVQATCTIAANPLAFGTYSGLLINATSTLSITCTKTTSYNVGLSAGVAAGATVTNRSMTGPFSTLLGYKLFSNSGLTTNWGNTVGTNTLAGTGNGALQPLSVYGQVHAAQYVRPGSYTDTVTATITY